LADFAKPMVPDYELLEGIPTFVFLVEHPSDKKVLFDLGLRKSVESSPPVILEAVKGMSTHVEKDIATILTNDGRINLGDINTII
jgi:hypothetical protein